MKKIFARISILFLVMAFLYGVTSMRGIRVPVLDTCMSYCVYPLLLVQDSLISPIKQYCEMVRVNREMEGICVQSLHDRQELLRENIELASCLDFVKATEEFNEFKKRYSSRAVTAQIISRHFDTGQHFFWIDAGKNRDVNVDMVVVYKNCLVGRVTEVLPYYSRVSLITDPSCKISAFCKDSREHAIHEGTGSLHQTKLTYVFDSRLDLEKRLKKGDIVLSSGEGLVFPKGFGLGTIESFSPEDLEFKVTLTPLIDFTTIDYCCVIAKGAEFSDAPAETVNHASQKTPKTVKPQQASEHKPKPVETKKIVKTEPQEVKKEVVAVSAEPLQPPEASVKKDGLSTEQSDQSPVPVTDGIQSPLFTPVKLVDEPDEVDTVSPL
jgi:rod shape-determining protein MreC